MRRRQGIILDLLPDLARILWGVICLAISLPLIWMVIQYYRGR